MTYLDKYKVGDSVIIALDSSGYLTLEKDYHATEIVDIIGYSATRNAYLLGSVKLTNNDFWTITRGHISSLENVIKDITKYKYGYWAYNSDVMIIGLANAKSSSNGMNCKQCLDFYPYANSNQRDGSLVCYSCRNGLSTVFVG